MNKKAFTDATSQAFASIPARFHGRNSRSVGNAHPLVPALGALKKSRAFSNFAGNIQITGFINHKFYPTITEIHSL